MKNKSGWVTEKLDLGEIECQMGFMMREKKDHNNYVLLQIEDLEKIQKYFDLFKKEFLK
jgi:hypothetical protein